MGALNERGAAEPLVPAPSGHVRDSVVPEIIGLAADTMQGAIQAWAVGDERRRFDGFLWCGGADAGGFLAAPDRGLAADRAMSLVADRLRAARGSGVPTDVAVMDLALELEAKSEPFVTTMTVLRERLAASALPDLPAVERITAALSAWVQPDADQGGARIRAAADLAAQAGRADVPGRSAVLGSAASIIQAVPFGLVGGWSPERAFTGFGLASVPEGPWPIGIVAGTALAAVLRAVSNGADLLAGLRVASALLRRLRQRPEGAAVDSVVRAAAARARDGSDHGDALATLRGTSDADTLAVAVYVVMTHPDVGDGTAAIALAERAGDDAACVVRVLLAALHGADVDTVAPAEVTAVSQRLASGGASAGRSR